MLSLISENDKKKVPTQHNCTQYFTQISCSLTYLVIKKNME